MSLERKIIVDEKYFVECEKDFDKMMTKLRKDMEFMRDGGTFYLRRGGIGDYTDVRYELAVYSMVYNYNIITNNDYDKERIQAIQKTFRKKT